MSTELDGSVWINLDDTRVASLLDLWGAFLEEVAHALQNALSGSIAISVDKTERAKRELEAAECLLKNANALRLPPGEISHCKTAVDHFGGTQDGR